jgi:hypothetical protein
MYLKSNDKRIEEQQIITLPATKRPSEIDFSFQTVKSAYFSARLIIHPLFGKCCHGSVVKTKYLIEILARRNYSFEACLLP